jgi:hypothetical protein
MLYFPLVKKPNHGEQNEIISGTRGYLQTRASEQDK